MIISEKEIYPRTGDKQTIYLKGAITDPSITVGQYTMYNDFVNDPMDFEKNNVLYHYPINHDRLVIGKFCSIACGAKFLFTSANHTMKSLSTYPFPLFFEEWGLDKKDVTDAWDNKGDIVVGNDVWIGYEAVVMSGVTIGDGAIIGARAVVTKDVEPYAIVGGVPAKPIKKRYPDHKISALLKARWWDWSKEQIAQNIEAIKSGSIEQLKPIGAFRIKGIPALLLGEPSDRVFLFVHGQCGCKEEAEEFFKQAGSKGWQVLAIDLPEHGDRKQEAAELVPWTVIPELTCIMEYMKRRWEHIAVRANSIGAWMCMMSFQDEPLGKALFVSPILHMEQLIKEMMAQAGVTDQQLEREKEIMTDSGQKLSWNYYSYAKQHPIKEWNVPSSILYGAEDALTKPDTVQDFASRFGCSLTVMKDGEHWFHTEEQLNFLKKWTDDCL